MAKKDRKYSAEGAVENTNQEAPATQPETNAAPAKNPLFQRVPAIFLEIDGVQYHFDRRELPKKAAVVGNLVIDGVETPFQVTSNKGWTPEANVIEYIWLSLPGEPEDKPITGYITLDYLVAASTFAGKEAMRGEGTANRKNPDRIPKDADAEARRKAAAAETRLKNIAAKGEPAAAEPAAEGAEPAAQ